MKAGKEKATHALAQSYLRFEVLVGWGKGEKERRWTRELQPGFLLTAHLFKSALLLHSEVDYHCLVLRRVCAVFAVDVWVVNELRSDSPDTNAPHKRHAFSAQQLITDSVRHIKMHAFCTYWTRPRPGKG
jgi:hypothetical protein